VKKAVKRLNSEGIAGVDGVPGQISKLVVEQRFGKLLNMFNDINRMGKIPKNLKGGFSGVLPQT
jgi:hypothetical protein